MAASNQHLRVGELARRTGLTVRTLHHYDEIGLLRPSGRSESGYRLYSEADVARLHGIQALRHLGLPLSDIGALLDGQAPSPAQIIEQQMQALDREIAQATELRGRLALIRDEIAQGGQPVLGDWLGALSLMTTYGKYFSASELKAILSRFRIIEPSFAAAMQEVRALMDAGARPDSPGAQALARRWMALIHHWMEGDFELMQRWDEMYMNEPGAHGRKGPPTDMVNFMKAATEARMEALQRHFSLEELGRIRFVPEEEWSAVTARARRLMEAGEPPTSPRAREIAGEWMGLMDRLAGGDRDLLLRLIDAVAREPLLEAGAATDPGLRAWLQQALDPHAT